MVKRVWSILLSVVLLLSAMGVMTVGAKADKVDFSLATTNGGIGDTVTVTVSLSAESYFTNTTLSLFYDPSVVQFSEERTGKISPSSAMFMILDYPTDGFVKGAYVAAKPIKKAGVLLEFDFVIVKEQETIFSLGFEECVGEDENGVMFDVNYNAGSCVLNKGKGQAATTAKPPVTTKVTVAPTSANTTGPKATTTNKVPVTTQTTVPVTYPTDAHGITLAPHVVTESDGNAATRADGEVVTMVTTTTTAVQSDAPGGDPGSDIGLPTEPDAETALSGSDAYDESEAPEGNKALVPIIVVLIAVAIATGAAVFVMLRKKKATAVADQVNNPPEQ